MAPARRPVRREELVAVAAGFATRDAALVLEAPLQRKEIAAFQLLARHGARVPVIPAARQEESGGGRRRRRHACTRPRPRRIQRVRGARPRRLCEARRTSERPSVAAHRITERLDELPDLEFLVSFESVTLPESRLLQLSWQGLCHRGARASLDDQIASREQALDSSSLATLIYTSGTTGNPKGVMLTHGNLLSNVESMIPIAFLESDDILLSWLPYSHVYARLTDNYLATGAGITVALAAGIDTLITLPGAEAAARQMGLTLVVLDTVTGGDAERLYARAGWSRVGVIPGFALSTDGWPEATTVFYKALAQ